MNRVFEIQVTKRDDSLEFQSQALLDMAKKREKNFRITKQFLWSKSNIPWITIQETISNLGKALPHKKAYSGKTGMQKMFMGQKLRFSYFLEQQHFV